MRVTLFGN